MTIPSPILWQNVESTIFLIDVPCSISTAQGLEDHHTKKRLLSTTPIRLPFTSNEPKSQNARRKLKTTDDVVELHVQYQTLLQHALKEVKQDFDGEWCLIRSVADDSSETSKKRPLDETNQQPLNTLTDLLGLQYRLHSAEDVLSVDHGAHLDEYLPFNNHFSNDKDDPTGLSLLHPFNTDHIATYYIPAQSTFALSDCSDADSFHDFVHIEAENNQARPTFDFILLDPPWPNRSVRRTHKTPGSTYTVTSSMSAIRDLLLNLNLPNLMAEDSQIGMWITNKTSVRDAVLNSTNGLFAAWDVALEEEWLWVKTTVHGEPVLPLDGLWRKPYEVLLLGRKRRPRVDGEEGRKDTNERNEIKRRVLVSVPDLHSRKPCLKTLIESRMRDPLDYQALEVFARHLVAGWWSWGNECLKFNETKWWSGRETTRAK